MLNGPKASVVARRKGFETKKYYEDEAVVF